MSVGKIPALGARKGAVPIPLSRSTHVVQFYEQDHALVEELGRLIGTSLLNGDAAMVLATRPHRDALAQELVARGLNISAVSAQ